MGDFCCFSELLLLESYKKKSCDVSPLMKKRRLDCKNSLMCRFQFTLEPSLEFQRNSVDKLQHQSNWQPWLAVTFPWKHACVKGAPDRHNTLWEWTVVAGWSAPLFPQKTTGHSHRCHTGSTSYYLVLGINLLCSKTISFRSKCSKWFKIQHAN